MVAHQKRQRQRLHQMTGNGGGVFRVGDVGHQHEFVRAQPCQAAVCAPMRAQPLCHGDQQLVAELMPVAVVDRLEAVQVDQHHRKALPVALAALDALQHVLMQQHAVGQAGQRVVQGGQHQFLVGLRQRLRQHVGALLEAARQHRDHQRQPQQAQGDRRHHRGQPRQRQLRVDPGRAADAAGRKLRGSHAGVVHAHDGHAHDHGGDHAQAVAAAVVAQLEGDPQRCSRGTDGDRHRDREQQRVIGDLRIHAHRRHAHVVHQRDAQAHQQRAQAQAAPGQVGARGQPQRQRRGQDRHQHRVRGQRQVVAQRNRQLECQHADEMHRPDAEPHCNGAAHQPRGRNAATAGGHARGQVQRGIRGQHGHRQRQQHQRKIVSTEHPSTSRADTSACPVS